MKTLRCEGSSSERVNVSQILNNVSQINYSNYICYHIRPEGQVCDAERDLLAMAIVTRFANNAIHLSWYTTLNYYTKLSEYIFINFSVSAALSSVLFCSGTNNCIVELQRDACVKDLGVVDEKLYFSQHISERINMLWLIRRNFRNRPYGISRCYKHSAAINWNYLPYDIRDCSSVSVFKRKLKSHLFSIAYIA